MTTKKSRHVSKTIRQARELRQNSTFPEQKLWKGIRGRRLAKLKFRRQFPVGSFIVDFFCQSANLVVEVDGESHATRGEYDLRRQSFLESQGYRVFRVSNDDVIQDLESVLLGIARAARIDVEAWMNGKSPHPDPLPEGEGEKDRPCSPSNGTGEKSGEREKR